MTIQDYLKERGIQVVEISFCAEGRVVRTERGKRNYKVIYRRDDGKTYSRMFYHPNATYWGFDEQEQRALRTLAEVEAKDAHKCSRCGGKGGWSGWPGYTCYDCNGSGVDPKFWREFELDDDMAQTA